MKNISTGTGIALLAGAIVAYPIIDRVMPRAEAGATHVAAVVAAATAQVPPEPTIVWYDVRSLGGPIGYSQGATWTRVKLVLTRAWSDGRVESRFIDTQREDSTWCQSVNEPCGSGWFVLSTPNSGFTSSADINFDSKVDGADLGQVLAMWGDAPRHDVPPSTCPLNLINP
jgi:hypothetical protein